MIGVAVAVGAILGLGIVWIFVFFMDRLVHGSPSANKRAYHESLTHRETVIHQYLFVIKILNQYGYTIKDRQGVNTNHLILVFENPQGVKITLEHNYKDISEDQGKCFLISAKGRKQFYLFSKEKQAPEIAEWISQQ